MLSSGSDERILCRQVRVLFPRKIILTLNLEYMTTTLIESWIERNERRIFVS